MRPSEPGEEFDWDLAQRAKGGDEAAFEELILRFQTPIHRFVFRSVSDDETAQDLTQEVFIRAWFALKRVQAKAQFSTWLFQIAVNLCRDHAKSKTTRHARLTQSFSSPEGEDRREDRDFASPGPSPVQNLESQEALESLETEIKALPLELRSPFILGALEQRSHKEVATILGMSAKAVEVRIYRARKLLCQRLTLLGFKSRSK